MEAGKRAWYTLICAWADFLGIPRNRYTLASVRVFFFYIITHQCTRCSLPVQMAEATRTDNDNVKTLGCVLWNLSDMQYYSLSQSK